MNQRRRWLLVAAALGVGVVGCRRSEPIVTPAVPVMVESAAELDAPLAEPIDMVLAGDYACVLDDGAVRCWGEDVVMPDGESASPEDLVAMPVVGVSSAAAGPDRFCAVAGDELLCWGHDPEIDEPALEDDEESVERVGVPEEPVEVRIDDTTVCARDSADALTCWTFEDPSDYAYDEDEVDPPYMERYEIAEPVLDFDPGGEFVCAITRAREVRCWGSDPWHYTRSEREWDECMSSEEEEGYDEDCDPEYEDCEDYEDEYDDEHDCDQSQEDALTEAWKTDEATLVEGIPGPKAIASGEDFACVLAEDGRVFCWGEGSQGQLGQGAKETTLSPVPVLGLDDAVAIDVGDAHACAVKRGGSVVCWGDNRSSAVGGRTRTVDRPRPVPGIEDAVDVVLAWNLSCAIGRSGSPRCWGRDDHRRVRGHVTSKSPLEAEISGVTHLMLAGNDTCVTRDDGSVWCWGRHGLPASEHAAVLATPRRTPHTNLVEILDVGPCARTVAGEARCWKSDAEMHDGGPTVLIASEVVSLDAHRSDACAVLEGGQVLCWKDEGTRAPKPTPVTSVGAAVDVAVGDRLACAVRRDHAVDCWTLGATLSVAPTRPARATDAAGIVHYDGRFCVWTTGGRVQCWSQDHLDDPPYEQALDGVEALADGAKHLCALAKGLAWCWGSNGYGQLGSGFTGRESAGPVAIEGLADLVELRAGAAHTCARTRAGSVRCWGRNNEGQLGGVPSSYIEQPAPMLEPGFLDETGDGGPAEASR